MASIGNLYSKSILVRLTNLKGEDRFKSIHITVDYQTTSVPIHKTELIIKLTDESDPFFLYSLYMSEEDYQTLKLQQGLLVDFGAFGQRFIDLLCACEKDEKSENPKFQLQFTTKEPLPYDHGHASLNVVELNQFKHLCHLSLNFTPGNDADVKKYLATCWQALREDYTKLARLHEDTKLTLTQKLESTQQILSQKSLELDKLRLDYDSQSERILTKHMQELSFERDKALQTQYAAQQKWEKEKKELEQAHIKATRLLETRSNELENQNKDLLEKKYKNESQLQEIRAKYTTLQDDYNQMKQDLAGIRKQNTNLDLELHTNEKTLNHLRTRIAVLEQEVKDKDDLVARTQELLNNEQTSRKQQEELLKERNNELKKKQAEINHYVQEFKKGSDVVVKLQTREKSLAGQLKLKSRILAQQEKVMGEKEKEIDDLKLELKEMKEKIASGNDECKELKTSLQKKTLELDEAAKLLKRNDNIISWLNKQLNENGGGGNNGMKSGQLNGSSNGYDSSSSGGVVFKPFGTLLSNGNDSTTNTNVSSNTTANNGTGILKMSNSTNLGMGYQMNKPNGDMYLNGSSGRNLISNGSSTNINTQLQLPYPNTRHTTESQESSHSPSSLGTSNTNRLVISAASQINSARLDPKYFQTHSPPTGLFDSSSNGFNGARPQSTTRINSAGSQQNQNPTSTTTTTTTTTTTNMTDSIKPKSNLLTNATNLTSALTNGARLNKQLIQQPTNLAQTQQSAYSNMNSIPYAALISSKSTPTIASAYFPSN